MSGLSLESVTANGLFFQGGNSPLKYFQDCLSVSMQYRRAAGYFSSSVFIASDIAMSGFIERGGKIIANGNRDLLGVLQRGVV